MAGLSQSRQLIASLVRREIVGRYRGSFLGVAWSLLTPLFMLAIYTFVFGVVFRARWATAGGAVPTDNSVAEYAIILFAGLIVFQLFADVINRAPLLMLSNVNYVKRSSFHSRSCPS